MSQLKPGGSGLVSNAHPRGNAVRGTLGPVDGAGREATVNACGVAVAMLQGHSWAPTPSNGSMVNVGTIPAVPFPASSLLVGGKGTAGMVPTFTIEPFDGVGAQLCPCNIATATPQAFTVASRPAPSTGPRVPRTALPRGCALLTSPDPPGLSWDIP